MMDTVLESTELGGRDNWRLLIGNLRNRVEGEVFTPGQEGYDAAKSAWNLMIEHRPALIVVAKTEADVQHAVRFANGAELPICVQATGHGQPRQCMDAMLIVVAKLDRVKIFADQRLAQVGGGAVWSQVIEKSVPAGLIPVSGSSPGVGVVGYTLGGGFGILSRKYGLAVESVHSLRLVTPDGEIVRVSAVENEDLFWSILGGGGAYGVITEICIRLHPHPELFGGSVMFDASLSSEIYPRFVAWTKTVPDEVSGALTMITFPPVPFVPEFLHGRSMLVFSASALFGPEVSAEYLAPIRNLPGAEFDSFRSFSYLESAEIYRDPVDPLPATGRGALITELDDASVAKLLAAIGSAPQSPNMMIQLRHLEGAVGRNEGISTAVGDRRRAKYLIYLLGVPLGPFTPAQMEDHAEHVISEMGEHIYARGPLNWLGEGNVSASLIQEAYAPDEYAKLNVIKEAVDPRNRFQFAGVGIRD
jgi:hypothetical protein